MKTKKIILLISIIFILALTNCVNAIELNSNQTVYGNTLPDDSLDSLREIIETTNDNETINIDNTELNASDNFIPITINKSLSIIGENTTINGNGNGNLFIINNNVTIKNLKFTNTITYSIVNNGNLILENCTFIDIWENAINNTGNLKIIGSTFEDIKPIYRNDNIDSVAQYYLNKCVIYNTGTLTINSSKFDNITNPNQITFNNKTIVKKEGIIYNLNNTNIINTNFTNITGRIMNNTGKLRIENSNFNDIYTNGIYIEINTSTKDYKITYGKQGEALIVYNTNELILRNVTIKNVLYDTFWSRLPKVQTKNGPIYNSGNCSIENSYFENMGLNYEELLTEVNPIMRGGAIANYGILSIKNTTITKTEAEYGGAIYNEGNATLDNITSKLSSAMEKGYSIYNKNEIIIKNSIFEENNDNSRLLADFGVIHNSETGTCKLMNSTIKNNKVEFSGGWPEIYYGVVQNGGNMEIERCVFYNNTPAAKYSFVSGSYNIYNWGTLTATHNLFLETGIGRPYYWYEERTDAFAYAYNDAGDIYLNYNYFDYNSNPFEIYTNFDVNQYFILDLEPEYSAINIGEKTNITATLKLDNGKFYKDYNLMPDIYVTFKINGKEIVKKLTDGKATVEFNQSTIKGSYKAIVILGNCSVSADIDVGKNYSQMDVESEEIYYGDKATFNMKVTGNLTHQPTGNISVFINGKLHTAPIKNTKASLTISNLTPQTYNIKIRYEGDEDYCKSYYYMNYTVHKRPTKMNITIDEINYGETGLVKVTLTPETVSTQAYLYITDKNNKTSKKTVYVRNGTELKLKNYAGGEYNLTLQMWENPYYVPSNATAIFKVNRYTTNLTINSTDINAGETETLNITLLPKGEVSGEANLTINNHTETIFLKNGENTVKIENLTGGTYHVTVIFPGDKKYAPSNATTTFTVKKIQTKTTAKIENNTLHINVEPNTTGTVILYINDDKYEINLTDSKIKLPINFTKAENNIFIYYQGNGYYNYSTYNLTYEYEELLNLTGYDETIYNTENATYYVTLTDEEGYGIANRTIIITINKKASKYVTEHDGSITIKLDPTVGEYDITAQYKNKTTKNKIIILEDAFITGNDTQSYTNIEFTYQIELKDHTGKAIKNAEITFNINGKTYKNKTDDKGLATLNLKLKEGNYNITTQYKTAKNVNNIYVGDILLKGNDLTIYNTETGIYQLSLIDKNGKGVANQTITITLNNKKYTRTTDKNGQATLSIKLDTGKYPVTAQFNDQKITNTITVLEDAFLSVNNTKAYENVDFTHIAKLTDHNGKGITNAEITFKINDKTYTNKTNKEGLAILTLNLKEGNYTITSTYKNITKTSKIIIIDDSHLVGNDVKAYSGTDFKYKVKLTDHNNNPIANAEITFKLEDKTFTKKTDSNGQIALTFNLETGNYTITATYKKLTIKNNFEIIEDYILSGNDVKAYSETNFPYNVKLTDHNGKAIQNAEITFTVNGKTYTNKTDINGKAIINLKLKTGTYTITTKYRNTTTTNTLTIIEDYILNGNDIKAYADDNFQYKVNLTDHNGKAIKNAEITFEIDGKTYTNKTNNQGLAIITLNLKEGNYTITAKYKNITTNNELEIIENHILTGQNVKAYENTDFTYTVTLTRTDGTPIPDKEITFIINNRRYTDITNKEGKASKTLNLPQGNYTITAIYKDTRITNNLTIIEDYNIDANNIRAYANDNFQYKVNLTDHNKNPIKNAEITFEINGQTYKNKTDKQGQATLNLNLKEGNYTITATYKNIKTTNILEIIETYTLKGINVKSYEDFDFEYTVTLKDHNNKIIENAEITFEIDGKTYTNKTNNQGLAMITLNLKEGNYTIIAKYKNITTTNKLNIIKYDLVKIESSDLVMYYKDGSRFAIRLTENGTALTNKTVQFTINGNTYKRSTDDKGYASIAINLNSGIHNITTRYNNISTTNTITIKSTIEGNDLTKIYRNDTQYYATFYNSKGEPLKNAKTIFNINGVMYERNTDENGKAKMNINLIAGRYIITATNPENGEQHSNIITVLSKIQENKDLTKYYKNASQYIVKVIDSKGNPAKAGQKVTFNINGVFYERYTNETGYVKMNINLQPGDYIITAEYEGCVASNKIKVLPTIKTQDLIKKYGVSNPFTATLLDGTGKPLTNEKITFNINGVFYTRTTNTSGIAKLNINLQAGKYIITSSYNGLNVANTITVQN